jgi:hypothetical protein
MWIRATEPRFRYDQLMSFGWKFMLPVGLALVFFAALLVAIPQADDSPQNVGLGAETVEVSLNVPR